MNHHTAHVKFKRVYGSASQHSCVDCSGTAYHWSYNGGDSNEVADHKGMIYSPGPVGLNPEFYSPRCQPCHTKYDDHSATMRARHAEGRYVSVNNVPAMVAGQDVRTCGECTLVTRPGPLKIHQKFSGHSS